MYDSGAVDVYWRAHMSGQTHMEFNCLPRKSFCCMKGEGSSGILINLYCHMWEESFTWQCRVGMSLTQLQIPPCQTTDSELGFQLYLHRFTLAEAQIISTGS